MDDKDPNQMAAEKLDKETKKVQEEQEKSFNMPRKNMPSEPDQGPFPKKGVEKGITKGMGGKALGMKKGGKCMAKGGSASKRADGCCVKGKTKGRMI